MTLPKKTSKKRRKRTSKRRKKTQFSWKKILSITLVIAILFGIYHYKDGLSYYINSIKDYLKNNTTNKPTTHDIRNVEILSMHKEHLFGFDVSHYQNQIEWHKIDSLYNQFPLHFVFMRSTMGKQSVDLRFSENWKKARGRLLIRGAYHYYRPDENSTLQAENFIRNTPLEAGDFRPVLDIEDYPTNQSIADLKKGILNWLKIVEKHYGCKPIIYSGAHFYKSNLEDICKDYPIWIAKYSITNEKIKPNWHFWQFTDKGSINGIETSVDLNIFNGTYQDLKQFVIQ